MTLNLNLIELFLKLDKFKIDCQKIANNINIYIKKALKDQKEICKLHKFIMPDKIKFGNFM